MLEDILNSDDPSFDINTIYANAKEQTQEAFEKALINLVDQILSSGLSPMFGGNKIEIKNADIGMFKEIDPDGIGMGIPSYEILERMQAGEKFSIEQPTSLPPDQAPNSQGSSPVDTALPKADATEVQENKQYIKEQLALQFQDISSLQTEAMFLKSKEIISGTVDTQNSSKTLYQQMVDAFTGYDPGQDKENQQEDFLQLLKAVEGDSKAQQKILDELVEIANNTKKQAEERQQPSAASRVGGAIAGQVVRQKAFAFMAQQAGFKGASGQVVGGMANLATNDQLKGLIAEGFKGALRFAGTLNRMPASTAAGTAGAVSAGGAGTRAGLSGLLAASSRLAPVFTAIGTAGTVVAAGFLIVGTALVAYAGTMVILNKILGDTIQKLQDYSPTLAKINAQQEIQIELLRFRQAQEMAPQLAPLAQAQADLAVEWEDFKMDLMEPLLPLVGLVTSFIEWVRNILDFIGDQISVLPERAEQISLQIQLAGAKIVDAIWDNSDKVESLEGQIKKKAQDIEDKLKKDNDDKQTIDAMKQLDELLGGGFDFGPAKLPKPDMGFGV